jgi:hypothetical protein
MHGKPILVALNHGLDISMYSMRKYLADFLLGKIESWHDYLGTIAQNNSCRNHQSHSE